MLAALFLTACGNESLPEGVLSTTLHSKILDQDRELYVHLPIGYDSARKYPVLFVLDGGQQDYIMTQSLDSLSRSGSVPPTIVVGIPNMLAENRTFQLVPPFMLSDHEDASSAPGTADTFLEFMETELIPFVEQKYNVTGQRLLAGNSRGGLLVLYSLIQKPDLFAGRFCFSTPLWRQNKLLVSKVTDFINSGKEMNSYLYMSAGSEETENIRGGLEAMTQVLKDKAPSGLVWHSNMTPGADHQSNSRMSASHAIQHWGEYLQSVSLTHEIK